MKVGTKLTGGFLAVVLFIWVIVVFSVKTFENVNEQFTALGEDIFPGGIAMVEMDRAAVETAHNIMEYIIHGDEEDKQNTLSAMDKLKDSGLKHLEHETHIGLNEQKTAEELVVKINALNLVITEVISLKEQGADIDELLKAEKETIHPAMAALSIQLKAHKAVHMKELAEANQAVSEIHKFGFQAVLILSFFMTLLGVTIAHFTTKSIVKRLHTLHKGTEKVGEGNLDFKIGTDTKDEIGQLSRAFDRMTENLRNKTTSIEKLNKEASERRQTEKLLEQKNEELTAFNKIAFDRELKMIELKKEINKILKDSGREPRYKKFEEKTSEGIK